MSQSIALIVDSWDEPPEAYRLSLTAYSAAEIDKHTKDPQITMSVSALGRKGDDDVWETICDLTVPQAKLLQTALGLLIAHLETAP